MRRTRPRKRPPSKSPVRRFAHDVGRRSRLPAVFFLAHAGVETLVRRLSKGSELNQALLCRLRPGIRPAKWAWVVFQGTLCQGAPAFSLCKVTAGTASDILGNPATARH